MGVLQKVELKFDRKKISDDIIEDFVGLLKKDKKSTKGKIVCILPTGEEKVSVVDIDNEESLKALISEYGSRR